MVRNTNVCEYCVYVCVCVYVWHTGCGDAEKAKIAELAPEGAELCVCM